MPRRLRATAWRFRFCVAAACLAVALWWTVGQLRPPDPPSVPVTVAARDLAAGTVLAAGDLRTVAHTGVGFAALDLETAVGGRLAVALPEGAPVLGSALVGPGLVDGAPPGTVVIGVRLADPGTAGLVRSGDRIDLYLAPADTGAGGTDATLVAQGVLVLALDLGTSDAGGLLAGPAATDGAAVVVAVSRDDVPAVAGATGLAPLRAVLVPP